MVVPQSPVKVVRTLNEVLKSRESSAKKPKAKPSNKKTRKLLDFDEKKPEKVQSTLHQHFKVRRSERKTKKTCQREEKKRIEEAILTGKEEGLEIRVLEEKGRGVFSKRDLKRGELICEYAGDLISAQKARQREKEYELQPELGCYMYFFEYKGKKYCVDATKESGRLGRLLNHSKTKNNVQTKLFPVREIPHLILVAQRDIKCDEELVYDYGDRSKLAIESHPWLKT